MQKDIVYYRDAIKEIVEEARQNNILIELWEDCEGVGVYCEDLITKESCKIKNIR